MTDSANDNPAAAEVARVAALVSFDVLDTPPEAVFDEFAQLAAAVLRAPMAVVNFVDTERMWLKACNFKNAAAMAREGSPCLLAMQASDVLVIADARADSRVNQHSWITGEPNVRFYAGAPLIDAQGHALGTLCVMDVVPRDLTFEQADALRMLSRHVVAQLELRRRIAVFKRDDSPRKALLAALKRAVRGGEFVVHYQPKISLATGQTVGLEALIRWDRPGYGLVSPLEFIPLLEESGLILEVGAWVLEQSADHHRDWIRKGLEAPRIAVNISPAQFNDGRFLAELVRTTGADDLTHGGVDLEISESVLSSNPAEVVEKLAAIRGMGFSVSVDNFGIGHSSWAYLTRLPVNALKIDRSFIPAMTADGRGIPVVAAMIALAHGLHLRVVAEGVETQAQRDTLTQMKCDEIQGYLISRPLTKREIEHFLRERAAQTTASRTAPRAFAPAPADASRGLWSSRKS